MTDSYEASKLRLIMNTMAKLFFGAGTALYSKLGRIWPLLEETVSSSRALDRALLSPLPFLFYTKLAVVNDIYKTIFMVFNDLFISCINPYPVLTGL
jgi:hypothetical protein